MSTKGASRPKLKGLRSWFRETFNRPSSQRPPVPPSPELPISQTPFLLKPSTRSHTTRDGPEKQNIATSAHQRPNIVQSATGPPVISAEVVSSWPISPPSGTLHEIHETTRQPSEQIALPLTDQQPRPSQSVSTISAEHAAAQATLEPADVARDRAEDSNNTNATENQPREHDLKLLVGHQPITSHRTITDEQADTEFSPPPDVHRPITAGTKIAGINEPRRVKDALLQLRSVLHHSQTTGLVPPVHTSLPDFMFNGERSRLHFCDSIEQSRLTAEGCFLVMAEQLRFNICDLESSFIPDNKVENMHARIEKNISPSLAYACRHWADYLELVPKSDNLLQMLDHFLSNQLLFWMEVLSLRKDLTTGIESLFKAKQWLMGVGYLWADLVLLAEDARQFLVDFTTSRASQSTPHIYISSLPSCPRSSLVYRHYWKRTRGLLELKGSLMELRRPVMLATWKIGSQVRSVAYSPDGSRVVVGCGDGTVTIRNAYNGTVLVGPLEGHTGSVRSVALSPNGQLLATGSWDKTIRVWDANDGTLVAGPIEGHTGWVYSVSFSPDSTRVASSSQENTIRVWDALHGTLLLGPLKGHSGSVYAVTFSPNENLIASASVDCTIRLWNVRDGTPAADPLKGHSRTIGTIVFTPDGTQLVSGSNDNTVRIWNVPNGSSATGPFKGHTGKVNSVAVSSDGMRVASGSDDRTVRVWNINDSSLVAGPFIGHAERVSSVAFSPDGTRVISGSWDKTVRVWNVRDGALLSSSAQSQDAVSNINSISFTPDGHILSSSIDHIVRIWDPSDGSFTIGQYKARFFPSPLLGSSPDRSYIASTSEAGQVQIMNTVDGSLAAEPLGIKYTSISAFQFSYDSATAIIGCNDGTIQIQGLSNEQAQAKVLVGHGGAVTLFTQSPDCSLLASYSDEDKTMRVWNMLEPTLDFESRPNYLSDSALGPGNSTAYDTWKVKKDGCVRNSEYHPLFWLPPEIASVWKSPHASLIIAKSGILQIPKQQLLVGNQWSKCYIQEQK